MCQVSTIVCKLVYITIDIVTLTISNLQCWEYYPGIDLCNLSDNLHATKTPYFRTIRPQIDQDRNQRIDKFKNISK